MYLCCTGVVVHMNVLVLYWCGTGVVHVCYWCVTCVVLVSMSYMLNADLLFYFSEQNKKRKNKHYVIYHGFSLSLCLSFPLSVVYLFDIC